MHRKSRDIAPNKQILWNCHENIYFYYPLSILQYGQGLPWIKFIGPRNETRTCCIHDPSRVFSGKLWAPLPFSFFFSPSGAKAAAKGSIAETSTSTLNDRLHREHGATVGRCQGPMESQIMLGTLRGRQRTNKLEQSQRQIKPLRKFKKYR